MNFVLIHNNKHVDGKIMKIQFTLSRYKLRSMSNDLNFYTKKIIY